jgi:hypothetical protein
VQEQNLQVTPGILQRVSNAIRTLIQGKGYPRWLVLLNKISLAPIFLWPLVFYGSIFFFDNPGNLPLTFLAFILVNSYPFLLLALVRLSYRVYSKFTVLAIAIPCLTFSFFIAFVLFVLC